MSHGYLFEQMAEEGEAVIKWKQGSFLVYVDIFPGTAVSQCGKPHGN